VFKKTNCESYASMHLYHGQMYLDLNLPWKLRYFASFGAISDSTSDLVRRSITGKAAVLLPRRARLEATSDELGS
jgi:hypothetical protein